MDLHGFEQFLLVRKGFQLITIHGYCGAARRFINRVGTVTPTHDDVEHYVAEMYRSGYSYTHKTNSIIAIERWMEYIGNPIHLGRQKKPKSIVKDTLTEAEVTKLIFNCNNIREQAIIALLAYSGVRNKELCALKVSDIDFGNNTVRVLEGKGIKDGLACISGMCTKILIQYLALYPRQQDDFLFTTLKMDQPYNGSALRKLIKTVAQRAEIKKRVYPHLLRHSLAMNMLSRGAGIYTIKEQLRHSFVDTTLIYVNSMLNGVKNDYDKFSPSYV